MRTRERTWIAEHAAGLSIAFALGFCLTGLYLAARALGSPDAEGLRRAALRLRGALALVGVAWYGREILFPKARRPGVYWLILPGLIILGAASWPFGSIGAILDLARRAVLIGIYLMAIEPFLVVLAQASSADLSTVARRERAFPAIRGAARRLSFLTALAVGVSIYLLSVDFIFDYYLYSLCGILATLASFLLPLAIANARAAEESTGALVALAEQEEAALTGKDPTAESAVLNRTILARLVLRRSARVIPDWWDWLYPLGSSVLLIGAAMLYYW